MSMRAKNVHSNKSLFASGLQDLLDSTHLFTRGEWARVLGVSSAAISQWVNDKTLPRPDLLRQVLDILRNSDGIPPGPLLSFEKLMQRDALTISPFGLRLQPNLGDYIRGANISGLGHALRGLTPSQQRALLDDGNWTGTTVAPVAESDQKEPARQSLATSAEERRKTHLYEDPTEVTFLASASASAPSAREQRLDLDFVLSANRVAIIGTPGSGKTFALRTLEKICQTQRHPAVSLLTASQLWGPDSDREFIRQCEHALENSHGVLFVDGLDEVEVGRRVAAVEEVAEAGRRFATLQMVIATRPIPELPLLEGFTRLSVAPLTGLQMVRSIERSFHAFRRPWLFKELERFVCHLSEREMLRANATNPLFLRTAASLFERNAITPFSETELIGEYFRCLLDGWERQKSGIRARKPWASPNRLHLDLAALCFHLVEAEKKEFTSTEAKRWLARPDDSQWSSELPSLLSIMSGVFRQTSDTSWQIMHEYFVCYLAAVHIVESSGDATQYFRRLKQRDVVPDVFRLACGITSDPTPLLRYMAEEAGPSEAERSILLFEALAQPILAKSTVLEELYKPALEWINRLCTHWKLVPVSEYGAPKGGTLWAFAAARNKAGRGTDQHIPSALKAIHRARSGPAKEFLTEQMKSGCEVLAEFSDAMQIEGRLDLELLPREGKSELHAAVVSPQLM